MAPESVFSKAKRYLRCSHPMTSIIIEDAYEIGPDNHQCAAMCARCGRACYIPLTRKEWKQMSNTEVWSYSNPQKRN